MQKFKKYLRNFIFGFLIALHVLAFAAINYAFPHYDEAIVTGGEVRRMDKDDFSDNRNQSDDLTRNTYFIYTRELNGTKVMPYRNEDTGWGLPLYFKFDSADVQAAAQSLVGEGRAQIKYYGWRIAVLDMFRNAVSVKKLKEGETRANPVFSYIFYALTAVSFVVCAVFVRRKFKDEPSSNL